MVPPDAGCDYPARRFTTTSEQQREPVALLDAQRRRGVDGARDVVGVPRGFELTTELGGVSVRFARVVTAMSDRTLVQGLVACGATSADCSTSVTWSSVTFGGMVEPP